MGRFSCHQRVFAAFYQRRFVSRLKDTKRRGGIKRGKKKRKEKKKKGGEGTYSYRFSIRGRFFFACHARVRTPVQMDAKKGDEEMFIESSFPFVSITAPFMRRSNVFASPQTIVSMCPETKEKK